jgi:hypothetical protein
MNGKDSAISSLYMFFAYTFAGSLFAAALKSVPARLQLRRAARRQHHNT